MSARRGKRPRDRGSEELVELHELYEEGIFAEQDYRAALEAHREKYGATAAVQNGEVCRGACCAIQSHEQTPTLRLRCVGTRSTFHPSPQ